MSSSKLKPVVVLGGGGHARVLIDALVLRGRKIQAISDPQLSKESELGKKFTLINDAEVAKLDPASIELMNGIGSLPRQDARRKVQETFSALGFRFASIAHPSATIGSNVELGEGVQVMAGVIIQAGTHIHAHSILNTGSIVDHDGRIGKHVHIAPGAVLSGDVELGDHVHIGTGASIIHGVKIGQNSVVGAGAVVTKSVGDNMIVYPARGVTAKL